MVLGLLVSNTSFSEETYLVCGKNKKNPVHVVFDDNSGFEKWKINKTYRQFDFDIIKKSKHYIELKRVLRHWKINRYTGLGIVDVGGSTWEYHCEKQEKKF